MPRKARPIPKQQFPTGLPYGKQQQLQQQARALPTRQAPTVPSAPVAARPTQAPADALNKITTEGWDLPAVTPLNAPTQRPGEPITAGLPVGLGPGPEVLPRFQQDGLAQTLQMLAQATGDSNFAYLAMLDQQSKGY